MRFIRCDVATYGIGMAASMGAVLLAAGEKGKRYALPNAKIMIHQPWTRGIGGSASDVLALAERVRDDVYAQIGVRLQFEVVIWRDEA